MRPGYRRREPERTLLHATVRTHLKTFLAEMKQRGDGAGLPGFVISEFERYLACGILAHGFARVRCSSCGNEMLAPCTGAPGPAGEPLTIMAWNPSRPGAA